jgi:type I restriction-modification system DNA methylase subunit
MSSTTFRQSIQDLLAALPTQRLDALKKLFWIELNYNRANAPLRADNYPAGLQEKLVAQPLLFATAGDGEQFHVIYCHLNTERLAIGVERQIISQLLVQHPYGLFLFSDKAQVHWHFVNVKYEKELSGSKRIRRVFRRLTIGPEERLRTATERIALLDTATLSRDLLRVSPLIIQQRHDEAFNVEAVTERFFDEYQKMFRTLKELLEKQFDDQQWAHEYALQFLNRLMFLYYVQRKRWLGDDTDFLRHLWEIYNDSQHSSDTFVSDWLNVLFFEAFNFKFKAGRADRAYFPDKIRDALALAPYLNGGLFAENRLDREYRAFIDDGQFKTIFSFFEQYNFTISEDTPLDQEVAVDPEMIGKVYESLVNVSEEADERGEAGIFYTPRVEIDLMCRLALVDYLSNHLGSERKNLLYEVVFAFDDDDKIAADAQISAQNLWNGLDSLLRNVTVLDPSCGSGSFLVGMLHVLDDLRARANNHLGNNDETAYGRKNEIIRNSLYGVDVMRWAVHVAELRLWLQLVIDTDIPYGERIIRPLLPNLSFKIRHGDSLVQEVGGVNLAMRHGGNMPTALKGKLTELKGEKRKFYNNSDEPRQYHSEAELRQAELLLFREIVNTQVQGLQTRIQELGQKLRPQPNLFGETTESQMKSTQAADRAELEKLQSDLDSAHRAQTALRQANDVPFVWDIAFVEIFEDEKGGFDVVIGNPPYVRQEKIHDPMLPVEEANKPDAKKVYKAKLMRSVYTKWPQTFGYDWNKDKSTWGLDAKSDLYIYFYFHSLSLLNSKGAFCFITSNSWLDVGYGKDLQEFLLTRGKVKWILDNQSHRSFASADVNTVIALLSSPQDDKTVCRVSQEHIARFVMLTVPFEYTLTPVFWQELEYAHVRTTTPEYRLFLSPQSELHQNGIDPDSKKYEGDKWGGKFLRAPDIYWVVSEKAKDKLVRLCEVSDVRFGIKTGSNEFFYLDADAILEWGIEKEFLRPVLRRPKECERILLDVNEFQYQVFLCDKPKALLTGTAALKFIQYGEKLGINKLASCASRKLWYSLGSPKKIQIAAKKTTKYRHYFPVSQEPILVDNRFYEIHPNGDFTESLAASLNSLLTPLWLESTGRAIGGGGGPLDIMVFELKNALVIDPKLVQRGFSFWKMDMINRPVLRIWDEMQLKDRQEFDELMFGLMGLTKAEQDGVREAVVDLVRIRLEKASSFRIEQNAKELSEMDW